MRLLAMPLSFMPSPNGAQVASDLQRVAARGVALLENTRFLPGDESNDPELATSWAALGDLFVNDAFRVAHRAHASTSGLAEAVRANGGEAVAGLLSAVMHHQRDLVEPVRRLLPLVNMKGYEKKSGRQTGDRGQLRFKAPASFVNQGAFDLTITGVDVQQMDDRGKGMSKVVPVADFALRLKPGMTGETREVWVTTAEAPRRRLLVCTVGAAEETGIELSIQSVKRTGKLQY